jgi:hypothetical protein
MICTIVLTTQHIVPSVIIWGRIHSDRTIGWSRSKNSLVLELTQQGRVLIGTCKYRMKAYVQLSLYLITTP